jgi:pyridoxal phosphate enzyme (YggS family)
MSSIPDNLQAVHEQISAAARMVARDPNDIALLAVSKTFGPEAVIAAAQAGQHEFGENYLQEALDKMAMVHRERPDLLLKWHFIGPIQSNKTRPIAEHFDWVHSVEREKIAQRLAEQRPAHLPPLNICLQVNIGEEASKSGVSPNQLLPLAEAVAAMPRLKLRGLMAIPPQFDSPVLQRAAFRQLRQLRDTLCGHGIALDTLSMGMSADMDAAIAEGATIVRIGTAIFGKRNYAQ